MQALSLRNDLWELDVEVDGHGRVVRLLERGSERPVVQMPHLEHDTVAEGGHAPFYGLETWIKTGDIRDPNTGVLSTFASIHHAKRKATLEPDAVLVESEHDGLQFREQWRLPAGEAPLECRMELLNVTAAPAPYQFELFFLWSPGEDAWADTAYVVPGFQPRRLMPYGEVEYRAGTSVDQPAAWWTLGSQHGVAIRACGNIERYFYGVKTGAFVLGAHSHVQTLSRGEKLRAVLEIAPVSHAARRGWIEDLRMAERQLAATARAQTALARRYASLGAWVGPLSQKSLQKRALHLTMQYSPVDLGEVSRLLEEVAAPLGYNQLMFEVGRSFPYRTHPKVAARWAYSRAQWHGLISTARALGMEVVPEYNALAHQGESGLALAYPELRGDPRGWTLDPEHPKTVPYLCDLIGELLEAFEPRVFHLGLDEVDIPSRPQAFGLPEGGRTRDGARLFADHVNALHDWLEGQGIGCTMWADMLLYEPAHNTTNGLRAGTWRAIDELPRDIVMIDWVYAPVKAYGGSDYLRQKGFRVMGATWHDPRAIPGFARYAAQSGLYGMCQTTWAPPRAREIPLVCVLVAARLFADPSAGPYDQVLQEAQALALRASGAIR